MQTTKYVCKSCNAEFDKPKTVYDGERKLAGCPECECSGFEEKLRIWMDKAELKQYIFLKREQQKAEDKLMKLKKGSKGYTELYELTENNRLRVTAQLIRIQTFIYSIDNSLIRQIFEFRYINGLSWSGVATAMGGYYSADYLRITHDRFLKKKC